MWQNIPCFVSCQKIMRNSLGITIGSCNPLTWYYANRMGNIFKHAVQRRNMKIFLNDTLLVDQQMYQHKEITFSKNIEWKKKNYIITFKYLLQIRQPDALILLRPYFFVLTIWDIYYILVLKSRLAISTI